MQNCGEVKEAESAPRTRTTALTPRRYAKNPRPRGHALGTETSTNMASRRIVSSEKNLLERDDRDDRSPGASEKSNIAPAVPA